MLVGLADATPRAVHGGLLPDPGDEKVLLPDAAAT
jgi:hypothetical protein